MRGKNEAGHLRLRGRIDVGDICQNPIHVHFCRICGNPWAGDHGIYTSEMEMSRVLVGGLIPF